MRSQINSNNTSCTTAIILITLTKETHYDASLNISNGEYLHYSSNSTQIPPYDFVSPNANSGTASMTNTLTFVCYNHIKHQISQNQSIDLQEISKHDLILPYRHKQTRTHKIAITTINKIDHFNNNATSQTTNETHKRPIINHHGNLAKNNLVKITIGYYKQLHNQITPIPIIILTVHNINHLTKRNNDGHHISNNHNNLLTRPFPPRNNDTRPPPNDRRQQNTLFRTNNVEEIQQEIEAIAPLHEETPSYPSFESEQQDFP